MKNITTSIIFTFSFFLLLFSFDARAQDLPVDPLAGNPIPALYFYENKGQIINTEAQLCPNVKYYTERGINQVYFADGIVYNAFKITSSVLGVDSLIRLDMKFHCSENPEIICGELSASDSSQDFLNYFLPHCGDYGITNVRGYAHTVYNNAFPDINVHYTSDEDGLVTYFEIKPNADPMSVQLKFEGQDSIKETQAGVRIYLRQMPILFPKGSVYQVSSSGIVTMLTWTPNWHDLGTGLVSLSNIGAYDPTETLVIKIKQAKGAGTAASNGVGWGTYYDAGTNVAEGARICTENKTPTVTPPADANIFLYTCSKQTGGNFPAQNGYQLGNGGNVDMYISKFDGGSARKWSTYYGGPGDEICLGIAQFDGTNAFYITGTATSDLTYLKFQYSMGNQGTFVNSYGKGFLGQFQKDNGYPVWRSKIDGFVTTPDQTQTTTPTAIDIDAQAGLLYLVGTLAPGTYFTYSGGSFPFPLKSVSGRYNQSTVAANMSTGFLMEFDINKVGTANNNLLWSTICGAGTQFLTIKKFYTDLNIPTIVVGGKATNSTIPSSISTTPITSPSSNSVVPLVDPGTGLSGVQGYIQTTRTGDEGLLLSFDASDQLNWCTFFGGTGNDCVSSIGAQSNTSPFFVCGSTSSSTKAATGALANTTGAFPAYDYYNNATPSYGGGTSDDYIAAFDLNKHLVLSRYFGGSGNEGDPTATGQSLSEVRPFLARDNYKSVVMAGTTQKPSASTNATNFPIKSPNNFSMYSQANNASNGETIQGRDAYFSIFDADNNVLRYSQLYGGSASGNTLNPNCADESVTGLALISDYRIYSMFTTCSSNTPFFNPTTTTTAPYFDNTYHGGKDAFLLYLNYDHDNSLLGVPSNNGVKSLHLTVSPNPTKGNVIINFYSTANAPIKIQVVDMFGRLYKSAEIRAVQGENRHELAIPEVASGTYFIRLSNIEHNETVKLEKL